jgi:hypothetical protein
MMNLQTAATGNLQHPIIGAGQVLVIAAILFANQP